MPAPGNHGNHNLRYLQATSRRSFLEADIHVGLGFLLRASAGQEMERRPSLIQKHIACSYVVLETHARSLSSGERQQFRDANHFLALDQILNCSNGVSSFG